MNNEEDLRSINELLKDQLELSRQTTDEIREQLSIAAKLHNSMDITKVAANKINSLNRQLTELNRQLVKDEEKRNLLLRNKKDIQKDISKSLDIEGSLRDEIEQLTEKQDGASAATSQKLQEIINNLKLQREINGDINTSLEKELGLNDKVNKSLGVTGALAESMRKTLYNLGLSRITDQLGIDDAITKTREFAANLVDSQVQAGKKSNILKNNFKSTGVLIKNLGKNLLKSLGPVYIITELVGALLDLDKRTENIAKSLGKSYNESIGLTQNMTSIATSSGNIFVTSKNITESFLELSRSLNTTAMLSEKMLVDFTEITKQIGYSVETAITLSKLSLLNDKSASSLAKTYLGQIKLLNIKNDLSINEKNILDDISNVSKSLLITFSKQPQELAKASFEVRKLGLNLKLVEGLAGSLLNIESSINDEFEAEVLTGRALNLERARYFALTNDIAGVAQEINKQGISSVEFAKMNRIQQDAIAKAVGMSRDDMGGMLIEQESIQKVGAQNLDDLKSQLKIAQEQGREAEFLARLGNDQYAAQLKSNAAQTQFSQTLDKLKDIFVQLVDPLLPVLEIFGDIFAIVGKIVKFLDPLLKVVGVASTIVGNIFSDEDVFNNAVKNSFDKVQKSTTENWGLNNSKYERDEAGNTVQKINDGVIDPDGSISVSTPKGSVKLNDEDTFVGNKNGIIAGTDLGGGGIDGNITKLTNSLENKLDILINEMRGMTKEVKKGMVVNLDGNKVSNELLQPLSMNIRNT